MNKRVSPIKVVLDTNILVSALWSKSSNPAQILSLVLNDFLTPCHNSQIITEYQEVLRRPHLTFHFSQDMVEEIIKKILTDGLSVAVKPSSNSFIDESDRVFYDVAKACNARLITGNSKHFPSEPFIFSLSEFLVLMDKEHFF